MTLNHRFLSVAIVTATLFSVQAGRAEDTDSWDGAWNGTLGKINPWPISISIAHGKVVSFLEKGTSFDVQFTKVTPDMVIFGDQTHYTMKLKKTGETSASVKIHGRHGFGTGFLTKG